MKLALRAFLSLLLLLAFFFHGAPGQESSIQQEKILPSPATGQNRIQIIPPEFDFGTVDQGEKLAARFTIRNTNPERILISGLLSNIKFLNVHLPENSLGPGEETTVEIILDTTHIYGRIAAQVEVRLNNEETAEATMNVMANIETLLAFQPGSLFVGQVRKDGSFSGRATLVGKLIREGKAKDLVVGTSSPAIEVKIGEQKKTGDTSPLAQAEGLPIEITIGPELKAGTFQEFITATSEKPPVQAQLQLLGQKLGIISVEPDRFEFFSPEGKMPKKVSVLFECEKVFKIIKVEYPSASLNVSLKTLRKGYKYQLTAKLKKSAKNGLLTVVKVYTDLEENPLIDIPVIAASFK